MREAVAWCRSKKLNIRRSSDFQLKLGLINFYPERGTIFIDRIGTLPDRGLSVLKSIVALPHRTSAELRTSLKSIGLLPEADRDESSDTIDLD